MPNVTHFGRYAAGLLRAAPVLDLLLELDQVCRDENTYGAIRSNDDEQSSSHQSSSMSLATAAAAAAAEPTRVAT